MQYTATSQEIFETFCISKNHKKHLKIDENNKTIYFNYPEKEVEINYEPVNILYEDAFLIAAFKPPFLLVHDDGNSQDTLQARINGYLQLNGNKYPAQAIHRIDYETSGLVLFCKHPFFQAYCDKNMEEHHIKKDYIALVQGHTNYKNKKIVSNIARDRHNAKKMFIHPNGKESISIFNTLKNYKDYSLIQVTILTGRKHQIRVQWCFFEASHLNDSLYGGKRIDNTGLLLQSHHIQFNDIDVILSSRKKIY